MAFLTFHAGWVARRPHDQNSFVWTNWRNGMWITPSGDRKPPADTYVSRIIERPEDYRVTERMPLDKDSVPIKFKGAGEPIKHLAIMSHVMITREQNAEEHALAVVDSKVPWGYRDEKLVELGIVRCGVDVFNHLCSIDEVFNEFMYPGFDIPAEFTRQTGITDDMAKGRHFDGSRTIHVGLTPEHKGTGLGEDRVNSMIVHILRDVYLGITLSDEYNPLDLLDYEVQDKFHLSDIHDLKIPCSMWGYDWNGKFATKNLVVLLEREGFFFDPSSAYMRCLATAFMLHRVPECMHELHEPRSNF